MAQASKDTLRTFEYQGNNSQGQEVKGELTSSSLPLAKAQLRKQGIVLNLCTRQKTKKLTKDKA